MAKPDFVDEMEHITRICTRLFLDGSERMALEELDKRVEKVVRAIDMQPELLDTHEPVVRDKYRKFRWGAYLEMEYLRNGAGIQRKGGR